MRFYTEENELKSSLTVAAVWNIIVFFMYGIDKLKAKRSKWRISENALIVPAFLLGGLGAAFGMIVFNHKTSKIKFRILVPLAFIVNIAFLIAVYMYFKTSVQTRFGI